MKAGNNKLKIDNDENEISFRPSSPLEEPILPPSSETDQMDEEKPKVEALKEERKESESSSSTSPSVIKLPTIPLCIPNSPMGSLKKKVITPAKPPQMPTVVEEEEHEDREPAFKTPLPPTRSERKSVRYGVSPLLDDLRTDICFERGSWSDRQRKKKGLTPKSTSPLMDLFDDLDDDDVPTTEEAVAGATATSTEEVTKRRLSDVFDDIADDNDDQANVNSGLSIPYFRSLFQGTKYKLIQHCDQWEEKLKIFEGEDRENKEELKGRIFAAIGQGRLIMNPKGRLEQFHTLIDSSEFKRGEKETKLEDLQGFWDMIDYQIQNIYKEFAALTELENKIGKRGNPKRKPSPKNRKKSKPHPQSSVAGSLKRLLTPV